MYITILMYFISVLLTDLYYYYKSLYVNITFCNVTSTASMTTKITDIFLQCKLAFPLCMISLSLIAYCGSLKSALATAIASLNYYAVNHL